MTDITKYRNVSLTHETYKTLISLSKVLLPDATLSISKTIESIANEKAGIIKKNTPLILSLQDESVNAHIHKIAKQKNAPVVDIEKIREISLSSEGLSLIHI